MAADRQSLSPARARRAAKRGVHWVKPELVAEIEFAGWTGDGMVRQAAFKGLRADKPARGSGGRDAARRPRNWPSPRRQKRSKVDSVVMNIPISHPDKALWPDAGDGKPVTKLDLARYYEAVGDWMLPHIKGRPCSIVRAPDGIKASEHFFQRHADAGAVQPVQPGESLGRPQALSADRPGRSAGRGGADRRRWNCIPGIARPATPDVPGRFVFDLDPAPDLDFDDVVAAARELKERLEAIGPGRLLQDHRRQGPACGDAVRGDGKERIGWPEAKTIAREICAPHGADSPDKYLVNMSKDKRTGKIFLDYLRNDRMATAVAPLSPRARDGATVSMPLELEPGEERAGPEGLHRAHGARPAEAQQALGGLAR